MQHTTTATQKRHSAQKKSKHPTNTSSSKTLYSFPRAQRFPKPTMSQSCTEFKFYDVGVRKYGGRVSFTAGKRVEIGGDNGVPPPTKYTVGVGRFQGRRIGVCFNKPNRENPGPGEYNPSSQHKYKSLHYSLRKKYKNLNQIHPQTTPAPCSYNIESTLPDSKKYLSIYVRKTSTKFHPTRTYTNPHNPHNPYNPQNDPACTTNLLLIPKNNTCETGFITSKGGRALKLSGPSAFTTRERRRFVTEVRAEEATPGPGQYEIGSEFPDLV